MTPGDMRELSREEIDAAFHGRQKDAAAKPEKGIQPFDFQKPDRIPNSQLRAIRFLHETFVRNLTSSLSAYLGVYMSGSLASVEQIPYSTFLDGLPPHTCMVSLTLLPYGDNAMLEISPSLVFPALELLLGGKEMSARVMNRELTEMERHLLSSLFRLITGDLERTWRGIDDVEFRVDSLETKRRPSRGLAPTEAVVAIGMEFRTDDCSGMINLAIPSITIKSMVHKFDRQATRSETGPKEADRRRHLNWLLGASVNVEPQISSRISVRDLLALAPGSLLLLDHALNEPLTATMNGRARLEGDIFMENEQLSYVVRKIKPSSNAPATPPAAQAAQQPAEVKA